MKKDTILVIFGSNKDDKPHAARAKGSDAAAAVKAANLMGYIVGTARTAKAKAVAKQLPEIKLYGSGRALVPRVKDALYNQIADTVTLPKPGLSVGGQNSGANSANETAEGLEYLEGTPWAEIERGSLVLAEDPKWYGWYEAIVLRVTDGGRKLLVSWRDWPKQKPFEVSRIAVGIHPITRPKPPVIVEQPPEAEQDPSPSDAPASE